MDTTKDIKDIANSIKSINKSLREVADNTISRSCLNIELTYTPEEIDRVLFSGDIKEEIYIKDVKGDLIINESILDFLCKEELAVSLFKDHRCFRLTKRGYTLKHFGGFVVLRKKENARIKRQETITIIIALGGWIFSVFTTFFSDLLTRFFK